MAGTETAELAQLKKAYAAKEPLLFYFYTPHWANQKYDLTAVELPAYTEECGQAAADETGGYACEYPEDVLYKAFNEDLQTKAPAAFDFLSAMSYDNAAQESIALSIESTAWIRPTPRRRGSTRTPTSGRPGCPRRKQRTRTRFGDEGGPDGPPSVITEGT